MPSEMPLSSYRFLLFIVFKSATLKMALQLSPKEVRYNVQPRSIYYPNEPADVIYFSGSSIEFTCDVFCERDCESLLFYNNSFLLIRGNIYGAPLEYKIYNSGHPAKVTLKISNATASSAGSYQCLTEAWRNTYVVNKESKFQMAVLGPTKQEIKFVSKGDSVFLPCIINASNNIYPQPDHIEWWKNNIQCDPLGCENGSFITQDRGLLLTNLTANSSYHCMVYWNDKIFNASRYHIMINQPVDICHATVHPKNVTAKVGEGVQFVCVVRGFGQNYSIKWYDIYNNALPTISHTHVLDVPVVQENGSYYCVVSNASGIQVRTLGVLEVVEPPHIADIDDVLVDINGQDNVTLSCSFTGYPTPTVSWIRVLNKRRDPILRYFNDSTIINGTTAILNLSNTVEHLGSYQCVATNIAGYVSRTARVLPKGWTNGVRNLNAEFIDNEKYTIKISWEPPDYDGRIPVYYYKLILYDLYDPSLTVEKMLEDSFNATVYLWDKLEQHSHSGKFNIKFGVIASDVLKNNRSMIARTQIITELELPIHLQVTLMVNCENIDVFTEWELTKRHSLDDIDGYCLKYQCNTSSEEQRCWQDETIYHANISGVPTNTTCWFTLTVRSRMEIVSNMVSCYRNNSITLPSASSELLSSPYLSMPLTPSDISATLSLSSSKPSSFLKASLFTTDILPTLSSLSSESSSFLKASLFTTDISPTLSSSLPSSISSSFFNTNVPPTLLPPSSKLLPSIILSMSSNISPSVVHQSNVNSPTNIWPYMLLLIIFTLLTFLGIVAVIFVMRKKNNNRNKLTHEQLNEVHKAFGASDFDDNIKDAISDTETIIIDDDKLSLFDAMQYCDTEKMYRKITNSNTCDSALSLQFIGSNIDFDSSNDSGEAASSRGCASHYFNPNGAENSSTETHQYDSGCTSHYFNPNGAENSSTQTHQYDSGNSIIDNDASQMDEGSSTKIS